VIYVDQKSATLRMSEVDEFYHCGHLTKEWCGLSTPTVLTNFRPVVGACDNPG
jgi:hypothetical protein